MRSRVELRVNLGKRPLMEMPRILASGWQHYLEQASSSRSRRKGISSASGG